MEGEPNVLGVFSSPESDDRRSSIYREFLMESSLFKWLE